MSVVVFIAYDGEVGVTGTLTSISGSGVPTNPYSVTETSPTVYKTGNITGLAGEFRVLFKNSANEPIYSGYVNFDGSAEVRCYDYSYDECSSGSSGGTITPPSIAAIAAGNLRLTLYDVVTNLSSRAALSPSFTMQTGALSESATRLVRAVQDAVRILPTKHKWKYLNRTLRISTSKAASGTASYDTSSRQLTISTGSWPLDAESGVVQFGGSWFTKIRRVSNTVLELSDQGLPEEDLTNTEFMWSRGAYSTSETISEIHSFRSVLGRFGLTKDRSQNISWSSEGTVRVGKPYTYSWAGTPLSGTTSFVLHPHPLVKEDYEINATVAPPIPTTYLLNLTDVTLDQSQWKLTSAAAKFKRNMVGAMVYISLDGSTADEIRDDAFLVSVVTGFENKTTVSIATPIQLGPIAATTSLSVFISSPVDIEESVMSEYFYDLAYKHYCKNHFHKGLEQAVALERDSFIRALEADNRTNENGGPVVDFESYESIYPDQAPVDNVLR